MERRPVVRNFEGPSRTEQSHRKKCNINTIVNKAMRTGRLPLVDSIGQYGDFSQVGDYHSCLQAVRQADEAFMKLPADVRKRFRHDPHEFIAFMDDPKNLDEAVKLGLVERVPVEPVEPAEVPAAPPAE